MSTFFRHLCELVLRHQMRVSNYFFNSFYSVGGFSPVKYYRFIYHSWMTLILIHANFKILVANYYLT
jgi:hypothetical protein